MELWRLRFETWLRRGDGRLYDYLEMRGDDFTETTTRRFEIDVAGSE